MAPVTAEGYRRTTLGPFNGLVTFATTLGPSGHSTIDTSPSAPTSPLPPARSQQIDDARHLAGSAPARAARRTSAPSARLAAAPVTSPRCSAAAMLTPRATARDRVGLPCRRRRCHLRCRCASAMLVLSRSRYRLAPRAARARSLRALPTPSRITSLLASTTPLSPRHSPRSCRPSTPTSPLPPALSSCVTDARPLASAAPAPAARRPSAPLARRSHLRGIASLLELSLTPITAPQPEVVPAFRADPAVAAIAVAALRRFLPPVEHRRRLMPRAELARRVRASVAP